MVIVSMDGFWNCVVKGNTGMECKLMHMPDMLRYLKGDTKKGFLVVISERLGRLGYREEVGRKFYL